MNEASQEEASLFTEPKPTPREGDGKGRPPAGAPYHRLSRVPRYRWWRPIGELVLALVTTFFFGSVVALILLELSGEPYEESLDAAGIWGVAATGASLAMLIPACRLAARLVGKRAGGALSSVVGRLRGRLLVRFGGVALACVALEMSVLFLMGELLTETVESEASWPGWSKFATNAAVIVIVIPFQSAGEEYLFRGLLMQAIGSWVRRAWIGIGVTALLFGLVHGLDASIVITIGCMGASLAWVTVRTGGLEAAIAFHAVNNVSKFLLLEAMGLDGAYLEDLNEGITWQLFLVFASTQLAFVFAIERLARRDPSLETRAPGSRTPQVGTGQLERTSSLPTTPGGTFRIRPARPEDQNQIRSVLVRTWHTAYAALLDSATIDGVFNGRVRFTWEGSDRSALSGPAWVAEMEGEVIGSAQLRLRSDGDVELGNLYVLAEHQGSGIGRELLTACVRSARERGALVLRFWVLERTPAVDFYLHHGAEIVGRTVALFDARSEPLLAMRLELCSWDGAT